MVDTVRAGPQTAGDAARVVVVPGAFNLRDLGGFAVSDGRRVRWGRVFRSGSLGYVGDSAAEAVARLGIRVICDLRRADERRREPTRWPVSDVTHLAWDDPLDAGIMEQVRDAGSAADVRALMVEMYRHLPQRLASRLRPLFARIVAGELPLMFHCSAGKDRTGIAAALLLSALGVPRTTVLADYLMTNDVVDFETLLSERMGADVGLGGRPNALLRLAADMRRALLAADADYLAAMFAAIDERFGSVETYLADTLGIDAAQRRVLADRLLEPPAR